jgi:hypothetical protein
LVRATQHHADAAIAAPMAFARGLQAGKIVVVANGRDRDGRQRHADAHSREIIPTQNRRRIVVGQRANEHALNAAGVQHLAEALVGHAVAVQPKFLRRVAAKRRALERALAHLANRGRGVVAPAIGGALRADERERGLFLERFSLPPDPHERRNVRVRMIAELACDRLNALTRRERDARIVREAHRDRRLCDPRLLGDGFHRYALIHRLRI